MMWIVLAIPADTFPNALKNTNTQHPRDTNNQKNRDLWEQLTILRNCLGKFESLIYEMLFIQEKKPELNT